MAKASPHQLDDIPHKDRRADIISSGLATYSSLFSMSLFIENGGELDKA